MVQLDSARLLETTTRLLAIAEACADTRDLDALLPRVASVLMEAAQADVVSFVLPPSASPQGPTINAQSKAPLSPSAERCLRDETVRVLAEHGIEAPRAEAFAVVRGPEITPIRTNTRTDRLYALWSTTLTFEGELVGVMVVHGFQDWILSPSALSLLADAAAPIGRALFQAIVLAALEARTHEDALTGALNRRGFDDAWRREVDRSRRNRRELSVVMIDVDHFKDINDRFGHPAGDEVLRRLVAAMRPALRQSDFLCRLGGDEFALILPDAGADVALQVADRVATACLGVAAGPQRQPITLSIGVAAVDLASDDTRAGAAGSLALRRADEALYAAKRGGRARVSRAG